jgi:mannan endo-1,4-beta-mannosidase
MLRESGFICATETEQPPRIPQNVPLAWIEARPGHPYFFTEHGEAWTPIGHNDSITWPELAGLFCRRDMDDVERRLRALKASGVNCLRLMLEYCQTEHRYIERPVGSFVPNMVRLWDDVFSLCERVGCTSC